MKTPPEMPLVIVGQRRDLDQFMHAADLFESFKALITEEPVTLTLTLKPGARKPSVFKNCLKKMLGPENKDWRIVAMFSPGLKSCAWKDPSLKMVSTGYQWAMFDPYLAAIGFPIK